MVAIIAIVAIIVVFRASFTTRALKRICVCGLGSFSWGVWVWQFARVRRLCRAPRPVAAHMIFLADALASGRAESSGGE